MENEIKFNLEVMGSSDVESMHKVLDAFKKLDTNYDNGKEFFFQNYNECLEQINN